MSEPWQHFVQSQRLKLSYWTWGDAANPPLILVHGGRDHSRSWDAMAEQFENDYPVLACDLRGHGDSEWARGSYYSTADHMLDLLALIDLVGGRATVVAHSFGGSIALMTAGVFPERFEKIVSIEGAGAWVRDEDAVTPDKIRDWGLRARSAEQRSPRVYPTIEAARDRMREANPRLSEELAMHLARWGTHGIDGGYVWKFDPWVHSRGLVHNLRLEEVAKIWAEVTCPVLHLIGGESHAARHEIDGKPVNSYFADSQRVGIGGAGHWVHHDQLDLATEEIRKFLGPPPPSNAQRD